MGFIVGFEHSLLVDLYEIVKAPSVLITDYFVVGGLGAAMVNAGLVGLIGILLTKVSKVKVKGPIIAAIFTMAGFSFLGKNIINIWPVFLGVYLYSLTQKEGLNNYILNALFGTALAPLVSSISITSDLGVTGGIIGGVIAGFIVPPLAGHLLATHQGLNLYNIGFTAGFIGTLFTGIFRGIGNAKELVTYWGEGYNDIVFPFLMVYLGSMIILGLFLTRGKLKNYIEIHELSGALVTDTVTHKGLGSSLINMGVVGFLGMSYVLLIGGELNGGALTGIFTIVGFGAFGKHIKNMLPLMLGAYLSLYLFQWNPTEPGPVLGVLFATTLAPISGTLGPLLGMLAGFLHMSMVMNTGYLHGGLNLYNNGFAGGIVATMMIGVIKNYQNDFE
ncbi:DUF1576 domain-containing protein [Natranaerobius thermophilus JW/NM-WN-LF]